MKRAPSLALVVALALVALYAVRMRVTHLDHGVEVHQAAANLRTGGEIELVRAVRPARSSAVFEVCSPAIGTNGSLDTVRFAIVDVATHRDLLESRIDARRVRGGNRYGCAVLVAADPVEGEHELAIVARPAAPLEAAVVGRIVTRVGLSGLDAALVAFLAVLAFAGLVLASRGDPSTTKTPDASKVALASFGALAVVLVIASRIPLGGAEGGLVRGALLLAIQLALVVVLARRNDPDSLGFVRTSRVAALALLAPTLAIAARGLATVLSSVIPKFGASSVERIVAPSAAVAHVETVLDPASGALAVAAISILAPVVEELFFRGVLYGLVERDRGKYVASTFVATAFVVAHVPQTLGNPAAIVSLVVLSVLATVMRVRFGSVVAPAATHLVHNALVVLVLFVQDT